MPSRHPRRAQQEQQARDDKRTRRKKPCPVGLDKDLVRPRVALDGVVVIDANLSCDCHSQIVEQMWECRFVVRESSVREELDQLSESSCGALAEVLFSTGVEIPGSVENAAQPALECLNGAARQCERAVDCFEHVEACISQVCSARMRSAKSELGLVPVSSKQRCKSPSIIESWSGVKVARGCSVKLPFTTEPS
jgi:hypothetical protein